MVTGSLEQVLPLESVAVALIVRVVTLDGAVTSTETTLAASEVDEGVNPVLVMT
jgi:hypothetical protein